jgi:cytochrome c
MKNFCFLVFCVLIAFSCKNKHDHPHKEGHAHDHSGHSHEGHNHEGHNHEGGHTHSHDTGDINLAPINTLTQEEKSAGWTLLFDGKNLNHWKGYKSATPTKWVAVDNTLYFNTEGEGKGGDIMTKKQYKDFELALDWKISECGNSGIFWNVLELEGLDRTFKTGPEMQILDNPCHPDGKIVKHRAGDLYDLIETSVVNVKPAMEWNSVTIKSKNGKYVFYQNGAKVVEFEMHTQEWKKMVAQSKFKEYPEFGLAKHGHIALQDHGNPVWFRNIRIREI